MEKIYNQGMDPMEEDEMIEACRRGNLTAYRRVYERYEQPLLRTACRMLRLPKS